VRLCVCASDVLLNLVDGIHEKIRDTTMKVIQII
jgi:hypothetical protein